MKLQKGVLEPYGALWKRFKIYWSCQGSVIWLKEIWKCFPHFPPTWGWINISTDFLLEVSGNSKMLIGLRGTIYCPHLTTFPHNFLKDWTLCRACLLYKIKKMEMHRQSVTSLSPEGPGFLYSSCSYSIGNPPYDILP